MAKLLCNAQRFNQKGTPPQIFVLKTSESFKSYSVYCLPKIYHSREKKFNVSNKITSIASIDGFIVISGDVFYAFHLNSEIFAGISFCKVSGFAISRTENYQKRTAPYITLKIRMFNFKQSNFSQFVSVVPFENTQAKTCLELTTKKTLELLQFMLFGCLLISLENFLEVCDGDCF